MVVQLLSQHRIKTGDGFVSAALNMPTIPCGSLVLAHGAGADHTHSHMESLGEAFSSAGLATLRFNFPFKEAGKSRVDSKEVSMATIIDAVAFLRSEVDLPILVGGHSFGGRMATHAVAEGLVSCSGMILCSFPLHPAAKPAVDRAIHLSGITVPMLFLSGTRDALADRELLNGVVAKLDKRHQLHWLDTADHSFKVLKRSRRCNKTVYEEAAAVVKQHIEPLIR